MPYRPIGPCRHRGCPARGTDRGYCEAHVPPRYREPDERPTSRQRGYDGRWDKRSKAVLAQHPGCAKCGKPATEVHHIDWDPHNCAWDNLMPLCHTHHMRMKRPRGARARQ